jgi:NAD(P)-dependent dehydrogenase (short-subunit alcohol dehydrogenase family)
MAALRSLAPAWAGKLRDRNIRVNVIGPDATGTPGISAMAGILDPGPDAAGELGNYQRGIVPLARHATAEEVASAALFLASSLSSPATGGFPVDSGINQVAHRVEDLSGHDPGSRSQAEPGDRRRP